MQVYLFVVGSDCSIVNHRSSAVMGNLLSLHPSIPCLAVDAVIHHLGVATVGETLVSQDPSIPCLVATGEQSSKDGRKLEYVEKNTAHLHVKKNNNQDVALHVSIVRTCGFPDTSKSNH